MFKNYDELFIAPKNALVKYAPCTCLLIKNAREYCIYVYLENLNKYKLV